MIKAANRTERRKSRREDGKGDRDEEYRLGKRVEKGNGRRKGIETKGSTITGDSHKTRNVRQD